METNQRDGLAARIGIGLVVGVVLGLVIRWIGQANPAVADAGKWLSVEVLQPFGALFLRLLFLVVIPLVFASLALGVSNLAGGGRLGMLSVKTFGLFLVNMAVGVVLGLVFMNVFRPGEGFP